MKTQTIIRIIKGRPAHVYPSHIKEAIVREIEADELTIAEAMKKYEVSRPLTIKSWIKVYGKSGVIPRTLKHFSEAEKRQIIIELKSGKLTPIETLRKYKISENTLGLWKKRYSSEIAIIKSKDSMKENRTPSDDQVNEKQYIETLKLKIATLETMIDIAEKEFNIEIRKKSGSKQ
jgi:transposase-like protein